MTLVVTHAAGFLACFTRGPDGTMQQRALIDTGDQPPTPADLAELGESMAKQYGWNAVALPVAKAVPNGAKPKPLPPKKRGYTHANARPNEPVGEERDAYIVSYLRGHPEGATLRELVESLGLDVVSATARWHHNVKRLADTGVISFTGDGTSAHPKRFRITEETS